MSARQFTTTLGMLALGAVGACVSGSGGGTVGLPSPTGGEEPAGSTYESPDAGQDPAAKAPDPAGGGAEPGFSCLACTTYSCEIPSGTFLNPPLPGTLTLTAQSGVYGCAYTDPSGQGQGGQLLCNGTIVAHEDDGGGGVVGRWRPFVEGGGFTATVTASGASVTLTCVPGDTSTTSSSGGSTPGGFSEPDGGFFSFDGG